jgi:SNF2 family DNA or RNA helicase
MVTEPVPGAMVRLRARPEVVGVVTAIDRAAPENRVAVFHDGAVHTYFVSQLEPAEMSDSPVAKVDQLISGLVANQLRASSSSSTIFSFNSGRIDYEPYQFRPVMKLIAADRPRILIADDVGVGKTIEAGLILKELQARQRLESVLVICPKPLVLEDKWRIELKRFDEDFVALDSSTLRYCIEETHLEGRWPARFRKAILPYSLLDEKLLFGEEAGSRSRPGLLALVPPATFDLVIVDEAHHVRNADTWRHRVY